MRLRVSAKKLQKSGRKSKSIFARFKKSKNESGEEKDGDVAIDAGAEEPPAKVSLLDMYKYAKWWEKLINVVGLFCAAGAGVSWVSM